MAFSYLLIVCAPVECEPHVPKTFARIEEIRELKPSQAARELPVHLHAVVTFYDQAAGLLFVQDNSAGIFVETKGAVPAERGMEIDLTGVTEPGDFAPLIRESLIHTIGKASSQRRKLYRWTA
jgi:hypothetical protein